MTTILDTPAYKKLRASNDFLLSIRKGEMATITREQDQLLHSQVLALTLQIAIQLAQLQEKAGY